MNGNSMDEVLPQYREPISEETEIFFRAAATKMNIRMLMNELRKFMIGQLCTAKDRETEDLKQLDKLLALPQRETEDLKQLDKLLALP